VHCEMADILMAALIRAFCSLVVAFCRCTALN
jgi:hypothetical protein